MPHPPILIGDAVVPAADMTHPVMTVYDIELDLHMAHCNWVMSSGRMVRVVHPMERLVRVPRSGQAGGTPTAARRGLQR
jgi:hypothetical protein